MNKIVLMSILVLLVAIAGGWLLYRTTMPVEVKTDLEKATAGESDQGGLFLQVQPNALPPAEDRTGAERLISPTASPNSIPAIPNDIIMQQPPDQTAVSVSIEDTGFVPLKLTVSAGTAVNFINNGQAMHWPASDDHPTHQKLPGFDAGKGLATGESYEFQFTKTGAWTYHDHLIPNLKGTITVE